MGNAQSGIDIIAVLLSCTLGLLSVVSGLLVYIFKRHQSGNDEQFKRVDKQFENNREDHQRLFDKLDEKADKE